MRDMLRVNYTKLSSGECLSETLYTKPEWTLLERLVRLGFISFSCLPVISSGHEM